MFSLCYIPGAKTHKYQQNCLQDHEEVGQHFSNTYPLKGEQPDILCNSDTLHLWLGASLQPSQAVPRYHPCKVSRIWGSRRGTCAQGCPALSDLSWSLLSCNQGFKFGCNFCWHSFMKSCQCKFLLCVTVLSVQIVCMVCSTLSNLQLSTEQNLLCIATPKASAGRPEVGAFCVFCFPWNTGDIASSWVAWGVRILQAGNQSKKN